ncbi:MAG TPA: SpoIIE family protein phosphatase [bacterium]|nr:SpoIIE family protein phosphatase [bacterium]
MDERASKDLTEERGRDPAALAVGYLLALILPFFVTLGIGVVRASFEFPPFVFLYLPPLLFVAFLGGWRPAVLSALLSTMSIGYFLIEPLGFTPTKLAVAALPSLTFLLTALLIAVTGDRYRLYQQRLRSDLNRARRDLREDQLVIAVGDLLARRGESDRPYAAAVCARIAVDTGDWCGLVVTERGERRLLALSGPDPAQAPPADLAASLAAPDLPWGSRLLEGGGAIAAGVSGGSPDGSDGASMWLARHDLVGLLAAALPAAGEPLGFLVVLARRSRSWDRKTLQLVQALAERLALSMERDRLAGEAVRRVRERALLDALMVELATERDLATTLETVVRRCTEHLGDWCGISLVDPATRTLPLTAVHHRDPANVARVREIVARLPASMDDPWTVEVLGGRTPVPIYADDPRIQVLIRSNPVMEEVFGRLGVWAILYSPIRYRDTPLGTFAIGVESHRRWEAHEVRLAAEIAERTGLAIQNARLLEAERAARAQAERDSARVSAVSRVVAIAAATIDLGAVYDEFAEALQMLLPFTRVTVSLYDPDRHWLTMPYFKGPELAAPPQRLEGPKAGTVRGWVVDTGRPFVRVDTLDAHEFEEDGILGAAGIRSYLVVPMTVGGLPIGTLNFGHVEAGFYTDEHARLVQPIASQLALTVEHARLFERQRRLASELSETIQRALLPVDLPDIPFAALAAFYRPADPEGKVGGDWYDALLLPDDRLLLSVGDVAGHGLPAASAMGQARQIIRAFALEDRPPARILSGLNQVLWRLPEPPNIAVWVGILDAFTGTLQHSTAGAPPPLLLEQGQVTQLKTGGPPLGSSPRFDYMQEQTVLRPGDRLLAYTDGLIEVTRDLGEGERHLREALGGTAGDPAPAAGEALLRHVIGQSEPHDDIALLIFDLLAVDAPLTFAVEASPASLRRIRRSVRALALRHGVSAQRADEIVLAVGEAALNAVEHAYRGRPGRVAVRGERIGDTLTVSVRDFGQWQAPQEQGRGRGTSVMRGFSDTFKTYRSPAGTLVEISWRLRERSAASS